MKKGSLILISLLMSSVVYAQSYKGISGGLNLANLNGSDASETEMRVTFNVGVFLGFPMSETSFFQPEIRYSSKGATQTVLGEKIVYKIEYIEVPLMFKFYTSNPNASDAFYFTGGPYLGMKLSDKIEIPGLGSVDTDVKGNDFGVAFGLGLGTLKSYMFECRYTLGLSKISPSANAKNGVISINLGGTF